MKKLIIVSGSPAAGKSSYGLKLAQQRSACLVDIDTCSELLVKLALQEAGKDPLDRDSAYFKHTYREAIYQTLFAIAKENLTHTDVIIVGPFTKEIRDFDWPKKIKLELGVAAEIHYLYCESEARLERMKARGNPRDKSKISDWSNSKNYYGKEEPPVFEHVYIDTTVRE